METKQVIIVRKDLNMRKGKLAAQVAHASMAVLLQQFYSEDYNRGKVVYYTSRKIFTDEPLYFWLTGVFTKIVVSCDSEEELLELHNKALFNKILTSLIKDSGKTEFNGIPTYTAVAIGPDIPEKIDKITGHLKLL